MTVECRDLNEVRENIDRLDSQILALLAERSQFVRQAARFKPTRADVVVPSRIEAIVERMRGLAREQGMDEELVEDIYRSMIDAFIKHEGKVWDRLNRG